METTETVTAEGFATAMARSAQLLGVVRAAWIDLAFADGRAQAAADLSAVSLGHAIAVQGLLPTLPASAIALVRPQFENLVRAIWVTHAATDAQLARLVAPLTVASQQAAKKLPLVPEMLSALETHGPRGASALLARARTRLGDGLNSYIHAGIHSFARQRSGYPLGLLRDVLQNSNAMSTLTLVVLATLTEDAHLAAALPALQREYAEILPELEPLTASSP